MEEGAGLALPKSNASVLREGVGAALPDQVLRK